MLIGLKLCGLLVNYCDCFSQLSFWRHPSTTEDLIYWCAIDAILNVSKSVLMTKQTHLRWAEGEYIFNFGRTIPSLKDLCGIKDANKECCMLFRNLWKSLHVKSNKWTCLTGQFRLLLVVQGLLDPRWMRSTHIETCHFDNLTRFRMIITGCTIHFMSIMRVTC